jgi:hypothetical protein
MWCTDKSDRYFGATSFVPHTEAQRHGDAEGERWCLSLASESRFVGGRNGHYTICMLKSRMSVAWVSVTLVACALAVSAEPAAVKPLVQAHAHNDYEHGRPLLDALDHGFCSVEADIWLTPEGLLVGHDRKDLRSGRTLEALYLEPLRERVRAHGGRVYRGGPIFYLLIDVKTEAEATYAALDKVLAGYADLLTVTREGKSEPKAVTAILSGNRASETIARQAVRYVGIDGRPENLDGKDSAELYPWISANWTLLFQWKGEGPMPAEDRSWMN